MVLMVPMVLMVLMVPMVLMVSLARLDRLVPMARTLMSATSLTQQLAPVFSRTFIMSC